MQILPAIDDVRRAILTGGLRAVERVLGTAPTLGDKLDRLPPGIVDPVVLVGGYANFDDSWRSWARSLARDGIPVFVVTVPGNATGDLDEGARHLAQEVAKVLADTGARRVDLVGFSAGGLIARQYVKFHAARDAVDAVVTLATPNNGIGMGGVLGAIGGALSDPLLRVIAGKSAPQMRRGSSFLAHLNDARVPDAAGAGVRYASVHSAIFDGAVTSAASRLDHGLNIPIGREPNLVKIPMGPDHYTILHRSGAAYEAARGVLLGLT